MLLLLTSCHLLFVAVAVAFSSQKGGVPSLIKDSYHHNWIVDNIPAAMMMEVSEEEEDTSLYPDLAPNPSQI